MHTPIRTGVVGFGLAGKVFHTPFIHAVPGLELTAIVQRAGDSAAKAWPDALICLSLDDLLASDVDLIVVGTPNATHFPFAKAAILAGKHVVVDKPVTSTSAEAVELEALATQSGVVYAPFHNRRWDGDFLTAKREIESGSLGRVVRFESHFDRFRPTPRQGSWKEEAGEDQSLVFDLGPHLVDQALALFGRPLSVTASVRSERDGSKIEDAFDIRLTFGRDGHALEAVLVATMLAAAATPRFLIHGTRASFLSYGLDPQEDALKNGTTVPPVGDDSWLHETNRDLAPMVVTEGAVGRVVDAERGDYRNFYLNVRDAIRGTAELVVTPRDAVRTMRVLEMARESSRQQRTLTMQDKDW